MVANNFEQWLKSVAQWRDELEYQAGLRDLWAEQEAALAGESEVAAFAEYERNDEFSAEEKLLIREVISALREELQSAASAATADRLEILEARLRFLEAAAETKGRREWAFMLMGVLFTYSLEVAVPPETTRQLFAIAFEGLRALFGDGLPSLPPG